MDNATSHGEEVPQPLLEAIHKLVHAGASPEAICSVLGLKLEEVQTVLAKDFSQDAKLKQSIREKSKNSRLMTSSVMAHVNSIEQSHLESHPTISSEHVTLCQKKKAKISEICMERRTYNTQDIQTQLNEDTLPTFIYSYHNGTDQLHRTSLVTGQQYKHRVPSYTFKFRCCWCEVPGGSLLITGGAGDWGAVREVVRIDTRREFAVSHCAPMLTPRREHAVVYHSQHLYVLGGWSSGRIFRKCERYVCAENRWEALPPLPRACCNTSGVGIESSLYALGGFRAKGGLDCVQKLSLESLTWELMQLRLPYADGAIPCFKLNDTEVYLVVKKTLYSFTALEVRLLRTLTGDIHSWFGTSYYRRGTLYCSDQCGAVRSQEIGSLLN
jgi:hypothetical protein